jgi:hypothetical protein
MSDCVGSIDGMIVTRGNQSTRWNTCPSATLSTTNLTWTGLGSNPSLRGERPATNRLSHRTTWIVLKKTQVFCTTLSRNIQNAQWCRSRRFILSEVIWWHFLNCACYIQLNVRLYKGREKRVGAALSFARKKLRNPQQTGRPNSQLGFELSNCQRRSRSANHLTASCRSEWPTINYHIL